MFSNKIVDQIPCFFTLQIIHGLLLIQENHWSHFMHYFVFLHYRFFPHFLHWFGFEQLNILFATFSSEIVSHISCIYMVFSIEYSFGLSPSKYLPTFLALIWFLFIVDSSCSFNFLLNRLWLSSKKFLASIDYQMLLQYIMNYYLSTGRGSKENDQIRIHLPCDFFHWTVLCLLTFYVTAFSLCHSFCFFM